MKNLSFIAIAVFAVVMAGCSGKAPKQQNTSDDTAGEEKQDVKPLSIYGICGDGSAMNTLQLIADNGDTLNISVSTAKDSLKVLGGFASGDRMAVLLNADRQTAQLVINETTLLGEWWQPNPIEGTSYMGINFKDGGIAESLDQNALVYKSWKVIDGKLILTFYREGGVEEDETEVFNIVKLDADSLVISNSEDTYEYGREHTRVAD